ncbi:MAG TPA: glycoside hydrolase family 16 protein, partial [Jatrophihabitantaceae bacterium]|nr:glycoside hydrolase family 16 protein [Jatrophihabitantaceae bacterium]
GALSSSAGASSRHTVHRTVTRQARASVARTATMTAHATVRGRTVAFTTTAKAIGRATAKATGRASATAASTTVARARAQHRAVALAKARARRAAVERAARRATASARQKARARASTQAELAAETLAGRAGGGRTSTPPTTGGSSGTTSTTEAPVSADPTTGTSGGTGAGTSTGVTAPGGGAGTSGTSCGGEVPVKADGTRWTCTFDDEFDGTSLDSTKWTAWNGYNYNSGPNTCYYDDPSHVRVSDGYLDLSATKLATPQPCWTALGWQNAQYGGAVLHTQHKFSQDGGLFEARIKFAGGTGLHDAFWLMPEYGTQLYPGHAEIDAAEAYGALPNTVFGNTHLNGANNSSDVGAVNACTVASWASGFHTYAIEWTAGKQITFLFDGIKCATFANWTALPGYANSAPFDQPFFMILQSMVDDGSYSPAPNASTVFPAVTQVDYVRVWK